jgi:hypothetical protein
VNGSVTFGSSAASTFSQGRLLVRGDFTQIGAVANYAPTPGHKAYLDGAGNQNISFSDTLNSFFDRVEVVATNTRDIVLQSSVKVADSLVMQGGAVGTDLVSAGTTQRLIAKGVVRLISGPGSPRLAPATIEMGPGNPSIDAIADPNRGLIADSVMYHAGINNLPVGVGIHYNHLRLHTGLVITMASDTIAGDLNITAGTAVFSNADTFLVNGSLQTLAPPGFGGAFSMTNAGALVTVADSAFFDAATAINLLTAGTLRLLGNFRSTAGSRYRATLAHITEFAGNGIQTIFMQSPTANESRFGELRLARPGGGTQLQLLTAVLAGTLSDTTNALDSLFSAISALVTVDSVSSLDIRNTVFNRVRLDARSPSAAMTVNGLTFNNMDPTSTYLAMFRDVGTTATLNNVNFATPHASGRYFVATGVGTGAPPVFAFVTSLPVSFTSGALDYQLIGAPTSPIVTWNGSGNNP